MLIDPRTGSHPAVRFDRHPPVKGSIYQLDQRSFRQDVIEEVVQRTMKNMMIDAPKTDPRLLLEETLYHERLRVRKSRSNWLTLRLRFARILSLEFMTLPRAQCLGCSVGY